MPAFRVARLGPTWEIRSTKLALNKAVKDKVNLIVDASFALEMATFRTEGHREALRAFARKRKPRFTDR